jgi:hypothetical protein
LRHLLSGMGARVARVRNEFGQRPPYNLVGRLERSEAQLAALTRLHAIREALGPVAMDLIDGCVIRDQKWCVAARALGRDVKTVRKWTSIALRGLAGAW